MTNRMQSLKRLEELNTDLTHFGEEDHPDLAVKWDAVFAQMTAELDELKRQVQADIKESVRQTEEVKAKLLKEAAGLRRGCDTIEELAERLPSLS